MTKSRLLPTVLCVSILCHCKARAEQESGENGGIPPSAEIKKGEHGLLQTLKLSGYTVFAELLEITGVAEELGADRTYTCFAPKNETFDMETVAKIRRTPKDKDTADFLRYHLIEGYLPEKILLISRRVETLNGKYLLFWVSDGKVSINKHSDIVMSDIAASNGVIHGVNKVLKPDVPGAIP